MANALQELSVRQLREALRIKEEIERLEEQLRSILTGEASSGQPSLPSAATPAPADGSTGGKGRRGTRGSNGKKRTISPEGRARIAEAAKRRWARQRAGR